MYKILIVDKKTKLTDHTVASYILGQRLLQFDFLFSITRPRAIIIPHGVINCL